jgi:hypothetical protein
VRSKVREAKIHRIKVFSPRVRPGDSAVVTAESPGAELHHREREKQRVKRSEQCARSQPVVN